MARLTDDPQLRLDLAELQKLTPPADVVFDFTRVSYLASSHLGQLLNIRKHLHGHEKRLVLFGMRPSVRQLFHVTSLELILEIVESESAALESLNGQ